jgi:hypothetical protein
MTRLKESTEMNIVVVYESMFGNTRKIASAIAETLAPWGTVTLASVNDADARSAAESAGLLVLGAPTHTHGLSRPASREQAHEWADDPSRKLTLEPQAPGTGVREWIDALDRVPPLFAAFDTRVDVARLLSGAASRHIERELTKHGSHAAAPAESFLVSKETVLEDGELDRARAWAVRVGESLGVSASPGR